ncbi:helix-turn-helix transcriptional regulator [Vagococcus vulneris]|uniref:Transcriptional regulator n=1 Tax=Vagococcus vulneris TaxID=1977869 RepID=A0A429ZN39_9ENTE|nr:helix-turn-helix transcriptional regulator [Vagococcus vulneris]RST95130.1 transcriptional regulator [Vagococcus vulneris]
MTSFESQVKKYRLLKEMTQDELANAVGIRRETIGRLEQAKYNPSLELAVKISRVLEVSIEDLFQFDL